MRFILKALITVMVVGLSGAITLAEENTGYIRINQVGYLISAPKTAVLMTAEALDAATPFNVIDSISGASAYSAQIGASTGAWSDTFNAVYILDFSALETPGEYTIRAGTAESPVFKIDSGIDLYKPLLENGLKYFQTQRDGDNVPPGDLNRQPAHLTDQSAIVYEPPKYDSDGVLLEALSPVDQPAVDVMGGWYDAGDYVKFVHTTSFVETVMLLMIRDGLKVDYHDEAHYGLDWLSKMWDSETQTLYYQVGIGDGNGETIYGDHDFWRLPENDDLLE
ncbi:MAG TPA: glycoside hydrolase family 9 protein, partial [Phototrophicaceae bacterium]|nr:glycoside hydrolase family 9 protein [Phototrophicaceae bacterium]